MTTKKLTDYLKQQTSTQSNNKTEQTKPVPMRIRFKKETEFQETPIGKIPKEWRVVSLSELYEFRRGLSYRRDDLADEKTDIEFITIDYVEKGGGLKRTVSKVYLKKNKVSNCSKCEVNDGDLLIAITDMTKGDIIGAPLYVERLTKVAFFSMDLVKLIPITQVNNKFIYYYLTLPHVRTFMRSISRGTTVLHLNLDLLKKLKLPIPPLHEQEQIAGILSIVDSAIEKVRLLIDRAERLKRGLMHVLLTRGVGHKEYKETAIGKIPKQWSTARLKEIATIVMGQSPPSETYNDFGEGMPFLQGKEEFGLIHPTPRLYTVRPIKIAEPGDVLIAVRAPVGDVNIAPFRLCIGRGLAAIRFSKSRANALFYFYYLQYIRPRIESLGKGTTFKAITKEDLENLLVPVPSVEEQDRIAQTLYELDQYILLLQGKLVHLARVKKGLMDILLTGKVRMIVESS